ncbi:transient receptor potential cation channel subfamily V member 5 [Anabrus simplex]|uniref:transient receptor potential cation channel subfamily V member 5 n=1 Tax=Anabrus simplex TaxID=316456 RepID=UPI0035A27CE0
MGNTESNVTSGVKKQAGVSTQKLYKLVDLKGGGLLVDMMKRAIQTKQYAELDHALKTKVEPFLYNKGRGRLIPIAKLVLLRNKERPRHKQLPPLRAMENPDDYQILSEVNPEEESKVDPSKCRDVCWDLNERGAVGETILHLCLLNATSVHAELAKRLLRFYPKLVNDIYMCDEYYGESVLHLAIVNEDPAMVKFLLDSGADYHERCFGNFMCPEDQKASRTDSTDHEWVNVTPITNYEGYVYWGEYPLTFAACLNQEECYRLMLARGANPDSQDTNGNTVLHMLVIYEKLTTFDMAYEVGASLQIRNVLNLTPLTLAAKLARIEMFFHILNIEREIYWQIGSITCAAYPLEQIDTIDIETGNISKDSALNLVVFGDKDEHLELMDGMLVDLLHAKWNAFVKFRFYRQFSLFFIYFLFSVVCFTLRPGPPSPVVTSAAVTTTSPLVNSSLPLPSTNNSALRDTRDYRNVTQFRGRESVVSELLASDNVSDPINITSSVIIERLALFSTHNNGSLSDLPLTNQSFNNDSVTNEMGSSVNKSDGSWNTLTPSERPRVTSDSKLHSLFNNNQSFTVSPKRDHPSTYEAENNNRTLISDSAKINLVGSESENTQPDNSSTSQRRKRESAPVTTSKPEQSTTIQSKAKKTNEEDEDWWNDFQEDCRLMEFSTYEDKIRITCELSILLGSFLYILAALREARFLGLNMFIENLMTAPSRVMFLTSCIFMQIMPLLRFSCLKEIEDIVAVFVMLTTAPYFLFFCRGFKTVGPFVVMIYRMVTGDLLRFVSIYLVFVMGFSQAYYIIFLSFDNPNTPEGVDDTVSNPMPSPMESIMAMFLMSMTNFGDYFGAFERTEHEFVAKLMFVVYMVIVAILLVNLLIAMMGNTYQKIAETRNEWQRQWARIVLVVERGVSPSERLKKLMWYSQPMSDGRRALVLRLNQTEEGKADMKEILEMKRCHDRIVKKRQRGLNKLSATPSPKRSVI